MTRVLHDVMDIADEHGLVYVRLKKPETTEQQYAQYKAFRQRQGRIAEWHPILGIVLVVWH